ncbi:MAG TPA: D-alanyl-D-alanine carboxypeptidase family protein [Patescibacteria group bacterium]|nr:D-alanyl-D-alanine carboxypeptidase family protein [Patescibacteria group bacterium]
MKKYLVLCLLALFCLSRPAAAQIDTLAKQAIIVDAATGSVLLDKAAGDQMPTSSMSKLMTIYMVFEALKHGQLKLTDELLVSERAWKNSMDEGSRMYIQVGTRVKVEDLVRGVIVQSGNDASVALAEGVAGTEEAFADAMNVRAKEIGLTHSHFMNATGLPDPQHYSTPRDLAVLAYRIITDFPEYYPYFAEKEFTYNKIKQQNRDPLLGRVPGADGLKTGHTEAAGYGLVGSAQRDGRRVILVLNGMSSKKEREEEGIKLMEWAFRNFEAKKIVAKGEKVEDAKVWLGHGGLVPMVAAQDVNIVMPRAKRAELKLTVKYKEPLLAPVKAGEEVGTLVVEVPEQKPAQIKLLAGADEPRKGVFGRVKDRLGYLLTGAF